MTTVAHAVQSKPGRPQPAGPDAPDRSTRDPTAHPQPSAPRSYAAESVAPFQWAIEWMAYQQDAAERTIMFFDALKKRANIMLEHERAGLPPVLNFKSEMVLDARSFAQPANYALLRIIEVGEDCWEDCVDPAKPPVIVIDPRAGHGPGIGGFKRDSEVGVALHVGHPTYFAIFFPEPCPGQTLADVLAALNRFCEHVTELHAGKPPILYGNCQAGWAAALVAAHCGQGVGPVVLNGSPLSYWAGEPGVNPMRLMAGLVGGAWLTRLLADLGGGQLDGAWLVQSFESLKPGNALWDKYANLFTRIDTEQDRFLEFERWWNGYYRFSGEEIAAIVENLFIGNEIEQGKVPLDADCVADLKRISSPIIVFASYGDNITPPHQALGWIPAVYESTAALKEAGQRIVYLTNAHVGHLGIFVSASVVRLEHRAILDSLDEIEVLEPGLYEMRIENPTGDPDCARDQYSVRFEPREIESVRFEFPIEPFRRVRQVSELNVALYRTYVGPWVRCLANPWLTQALYWLHPMRASRLAFSEHVAPAMSAFGVLAGAIAAHRAPLPDTHPLLVQERKLIADVSAGWEAWRKLRDAGQERLFSCLYGI